MNAPRRLLEDETLAPGLLSDLQRARAHGSDPTFDVEGQLGALRSALDGAVPHAGDSTIPPAAPVAANGVGVKLALVCGGLVTAGALLFLLLPPEAGEGSTASHAASAPPIESAKEAPAPAPVVVENVAPTGLAPTGPAPTGPALTGPAPTGPAPTGPAASVAATPASPSAAQVPPLPSSGLSEIEHLRETRAHLAVSPSRAYELAMQGHDRFRGGILFEEREGLAILALNAMGSSGAPARARAFITRFPSSALVPKMEQIMRQGTVDPAP